MLDIVFVHLGTEFVYLLVHLVPNVLTVLPVEAHATGFVLNAVSLDDGRKRLGHAAEHGLVAVFLLLLHLLPDDLHLAG